MATAPQTRDALTPCPGKVFAVFDDETVDPRGDNGQRHRQARAPARDPLKRHRVIVHRLRRLTQMSETGDSGTYFFPRYRADFSRTTAGGLALRFAG